MPTYLHVDMDAFYAAVELLDHPEWRGTPLIVGADPDSRRGVVATCSYEARRYGVHSAMPIREAVRRCPDARFVRPRMERYQAVSRRVFACLATFTPTVHPMSIDEACLDMTGCEAHHPDLDAMGRAVKAAIRSAVDLPASVGIAPSRMLAKLASERHKPDGLTVVSPECVQAFLDPLAVGRLPGVGPSFERALIRAGLNNVRAVRRCERTWLVRRFGRAGERLFDLARGLDPPDERQRDQSIGREQTFEVDIDSDEAKRRVLARLAASVAWRLRRQGKAARTITLKARTPRYKTFTRSVRLGSAVDDEDRLLRAAVQLLDRLPSSGPLRLIGISVSGLESRHQLDVFTSEKARKAGMAVDRLNERFAGRIVRRARELDPPASRDR